MNDSVLHVLFMSISEEELERKFVAVVIGIFSPRVTAQGDTFF